MIRAPIDLRAEARKTILAELQRGPCATGSLGYNVLRQQAGFTAKVRAEVLDALAGEGLVIQYRARSAHGRSVTMVRLTERGATP